MVSQKMKFAGMVLTNQVLFLVMFGWKGEYGPTALPKLSPGAGLPMEQRPPRSQGLAGNSSGGQASDPSALSTGLGDGGGKGPAYAGTQGGEGRRRTQGTSEGGVNNKEAGQAGGQQQSGTQPAGQGTGQTTPGQGREAGQGAAGKAGGKAGQTAQKGKSMLPPGGYLPMFHESFKDAHLMALIGFGLLATFLGKYGHSSLALNLLAISFVLQYYIMISGMLQTMGELIRINIISLLTADYCAVAILISLGAVAGKLSPMQTVMMASNEVIFFAVNQFLGVGIFRVSDVGNSMFVHTFGAYFGLAVSRVMYTPAIRETNKETTSYNSNIFSLLGTLFLWAFWPTFNSAFTLGDAKHRAVINTYIALAASCMVTFAVSSLVNSSGRMSMVLTYLHYLSSSYPSWCSLVNSSGRMSMRHVQRATLAGGVAVGTCANMMIQPWGAMLIGGLAGAVSTLSLAYVEPFINYKFKIHDTCGVHSLHGIPGILAGVAGAIAAAFASLDTYGYGLYHMFGARTPPADSPVYMKLSTFIPMLKPGSSRTAMAQMGFQMVALLVTIVLALLGGVITALPILLLCSFYYR
ncbi:Ammonium transporter Rh type B [Lamellibrachia satsuma]|nr:Ammonium transporter Rh type B [Lamellibrachia satsuma]